MQYKLYFWKIIEKYISEGKVKNKFNQFSDWNESFDSETNRE